MLIKEIAKDCRLKMDKTLDYYERELKGVRTGFKKRDQKLRSSTKFHKLIGDISGKLRTWK